MADYEMREFVAMDDGKWWLTLPVLNDPVLHRRLVRTQIEELLAVDRLYPLPALASVRRILGQLREAYGDVEPFNHPLMGDWDHLGDEDAAEGSTAPPA